MSDHKLSRVNKYEKRRKTTRSISVLLVIGSILIVLLISMFVFGGKDNRQSKEVVSNIDSNETDEQEEAEDVDEEQGDDAGEESIIDEGNIDEEDDDHVELEPVTSDDDNVIEAYVGNWSPIGTEQAEPHEVVFDTDSQDWREMEEAIKVATGLEEMTTHWIGNGGDQKVIGTVSTPDQSDIYRVYLTWITNEGWQPTKLEKLKKVKK